MSRNGSQQKDIANTIGVHASTISRELRRRACALNQYCCKEAQIHADAREWKGYRLPSITIALVDAKLREEQCSPEQISHFLTK
jgi:IS30 family transposase